LKGSEAVIDSKLVEKSLALMGDYESGFETEYSPFISAAVKSVYDMLKSSESESDSRVIQLAAAKANYAIKCAAAAKEDCISFSAGDVSEVRAEKSTDGARDLYYSALYDCRSLVHDGGFAFLGV